MDKLDVLQFIMRAKETKVKRLDLSNKGIVELPDEIGDLKDLVSLDLSYNSIIELPKTIGKLSKLEDLLLLRNQIKNLPNSIGDLSSLKMLDISYNPVHKFPRSLGKVNSLEILDASYCALTQLPIELTNLFGLKQISLEENPLTYPPQKVIKRGLYATMHYLTMEKRKEEASRVIMQVFNMPEKIQPAFRRYIDYFNQMISKANNKDVVFDMNFLNQDIYQEMDLDVGVENYLFDIIKYLQEKVELLNSNDEPDIDVRHAYFESKMDNIKEKLHRLTNSLDQKIDDIKGLKQEINGLYNFLDEKRD